VRRCVAQRIAIIDDEQFERDTPLRMHTGHGICEIGLAVAGWNNDSEINQLFNQARSG
jgi:hypothetical protein